MSCYVVKCPNPSFAELMHACHQAQVLFAEIGEKDLSDSLVVSLDQKLCCCVRLCWETSTDMQLD